MTDDELFEAIGAYRSRLVDQLESLTDSQWRAPSLCDGWQVRHVVGRLVSVITVPTWRFIVGSVGMSGFHRKVDRFAREFGEFDQSDLLARYRDLVASRRAPGALIRGAAGDLALAISGRRGALDDLEGDGVDVLRGRLQK